MDLMLESDIYQPNTDNDGNYIDYIPPSSKFSNGIRCPCGARKDHVFDNRSSFASHIKSKTHQKWLSDSNSNKLNFYVENEKLKEVVNQQKIIIAKYEKEITANLRTIAYLTQQLMSKDKQCETSTDLINFD